MFRITRQQQEANVKFTAENGIDSPLISDTGKSIRERYGRGRVTYLIDKEGIIRHAQKGFPIIKRFEINWKRSLS